MNRRSSIGRLLQTSAALTWSGCSNSSFKELKQNRLSHTKAVEAYLAAIDAAVWVCLQDSPLRRNVYRNFLIDGERQRRGQLFADAFMRATGANDQKAREASRVSPSDGSRNL
jgi:hypothetical protein